MDWCASSGFSLLPTNRAKTSYAGFSVRGTFGVPLFFYPELKWNFLSPYTLSRIIEFKPDVLHFVDPILLGPQVLLAAMWYLPKVPRVSSYHTNIALYAKHFGYPILSPVIWKLQHYLHGNCAAIMCPSPSTSKALTEHHFPEEKIRIWHRGVDTDLFSPAKRRKELRRLWLGSNDTAVVLLYVGRVSWEKNLKVLLEAYVNLYPTRKDMHLVITGDGPARTELETIFNNVKVPVTFTGYLQGPHHLFPSHFPPFRSTTYGDRRRTSRMLRFLRYLHIPLQIRNIRPSGPRGPSLRPSRSSLSGRRSMRHHSGWDNRVACPRRPPPKRRKRPL